MWRRLLIRRFQPICPLYATWRGEGQYLGARNRASLIDLTAEQSNQL